jgi:hypothetical protein
MTGGLLSTLRVRGQQVHAIVRWSLGHCIPVPGARVDGKLSAGRDRALLNERVSTYATHVARANRELPRVTTR